MTHKNSVNGRKKRESHLCTNANLNNVISESESIGYSIENSFDTAIAKIVFFDNYVDIGVFTEIMGITKEGEKAVEEMKITLGH